MDCLGSTLSHCVLSHTRLESLFQKKQVPSMHAHKPQHTHTSHVHTHNTMYAHVYICTHCGRKGHLAKFTLIELMIQIFQIDLFRLGKELTPMDPKEYGYQKSLLFYFMQGWALT